MQDACVTVGDGGGAYRGMQLPICILISFLEKKHEQCELNVELEQGSLLHPL